MSTRLCKKEGVFSIAGSLVVLILAIGPLIAVAAAPAWNPDKNIEIIAVQGPGSSHDQAVRLIQSTHTLDRGGQACPRILPITETRNLCSSILRR